MTKVTRRTVLAGASLLATVPIAPARGQNAIQAQPYMAAIERLVDSLARLGSPLRAEDRVRIASLTQTANARAVETIENVLRRYTLFRVSTNRGRFIEMTAGGAEPVLVEQGWRLFLIRIANPDGIADPFDVLTSQPAMLPGHMDRWLASGGYSMAQHPPVVDTVNNSGWLKQNWCMTQVSDTSALSGQPVEYRILEFFSRDRGRRSVTPSFAIGPAVRRGEKLEFECLPSHDVALRIRDTDGRGCMASLIVRDDAGRFYPPQMMRIAPDLPFQMQVYRADGETLRLPEGAYTVESRRGPEYVTATGKLEVASNGGAVDIALERWIDPAKWGWYSGDTHIHAAGCAHYDVPTEGVSPETMIRHVRGEGLSVGEVLTWGPGYEYQKQFFSGHAISPHAGLEHPDLQAANSVTWQPKDTPKDDESLLRYDVEISRFPSSHAGHLVLLRLSDQDFPGAKKIEDWPSWNLPILKWARAQGAVVGYAHCGGGMDVDTQDLPNYRIPLFDGLGTNEAIVDVTHGAVDFLSGCDLTPAGELNAWYHLLNCGFRLAMVGETDFPCITDERPGTGRSYVKLKDRPVGNAGYEAWIHGLKQGRLYFGDGRSHVLSYSVNGRASGEQDLVLPSSGALEISALVAARLEPAPTAETRAVQANNQSWHIEHARVGNSREVRVEVIVNGEPAAHLPLIADGSPRSLRFHVKVEKSSWVALRILPSVHTHPVFVTVGGKPIRASRRSAQWCRACVDKLWEVKSPFMRPVEIAGAAKAFAHARATYDRIVTECEAE
jgi:hypothetical protein